LFLSTTRISSHSSFSLYVNFQTSSVREHCTTEGDWYTGLALSALQLSVKSEM